MRKFYSATGLHDDSFGFPKMFFQLINTVEKSQYSHIPKYIQNPEGGVK
jgi:hypothetical protein